ncbi:hypothetical protein [Halodurantibacterium flavum]|uniref:Uncharacterized protein n=1 Tax=Halodurantibacterium flavum TaxID=1382802 RepID=A0ABW4S6W6_9RHOB
MPRAALFLLLLSACGANGEYPALVPLDQVTAQAAALTIDATTTEGLADRAEALRNRGAALRRPVLDPADRERLDRERLDRERLGTPSPALP